jgi:hypothetical protein
VINSAAAAAATTTMTIINVKQFLYRPLQLKEVVDPRISRYLAHEGVKVVSCMHWPLYT